MTTVVLDVVEGVALLTLNRPQARNAISAEMVQEIHGALDDLGGDEEVRALIVCGAGGRAFAAGADIAQLLERGGSDALQAINSSLFRRLEAFPRPTIAAVQGWALGGGCELALACDLRVCGESARFGQPEVTLGIIPGAGGCYRLPRVVGVGVAKELIYTGRIVDAREALAIGLVNRVVPDDEVLDCARALAAEMVKNDPLALRLAKSVIDAGFAERAPFALERTAQASCFESPAKRERMGAFLAERRRRRAARDGGAGGDGT